MTTAPSVSPPGWHLVVVDVLQGVADHADAHVDEVGGGHVENLLRELLPVLVDLLGAALVLAGGRWSPRQGVAVPPLTSTVMWAMMARWWPSSVSRAIWAISLSDLPRNIWQAAASISLFCPWIFTCAAPGDGPVPRASHTGTFVSHARTRHTLVSLVSLTCVTH